MIAPLEHLPAGALLSTLCAALVAVVAACATVSPPSEPPLPPGYLVAVRPGQNAWDIAAEAGLPVEEIVEVNGLQSADEVAAGQVLFIPAGAPALGVRSSPAPVPPAPSGGGPSLLWPVDGIVLRDFSAGSAKDRGGYDGVLIAAPAGTPVCAAAAGQVAFAGTQDTRTGVFVVVNHPGDLVTVYAHLKSTSVSVGQQLQAGDVVGVIGASGLSGVSPRLQFQVRRRKAPVDPLPLLPP